MAEHRLQEAETAATLASLTSGEYPKAKLDVEWTTLLRNQFHDILPGSSIREVNEQAEQELGTVVKRSIEIRDQAIEQLVDSGQSSCEPAHQAYSRFQSTWIRTSALDGVACPNRR